jgi:hypothetical protein
MWRRPFRTQRRAGVVLDLILGVGVILVGAFVLAHLGLSFGEIVSGARRFFGN